MVVTVDGPAGSGKSSVSKEVAARLGFAFLDTGALYRALALAAKRQGVDPADQAAVAAWVPGVAVRAELESGAFTVLLDGADVEPFIRNEAISQLASRLSALEPVRARLLELQRSAGSAGDLVAEGRDMGTVVFPGAEAKFFLTATPEARAHRRWLQLKQQGQAADEGEVLAELRQRDQRDQSRALSPCLPAEDALQVDTTPHSRQEVVALLVAEVNRRRKEAGPEGNESL
ncbi:MAG: (d)CMP kinase [Desulfarculaceae bacterium]|nr:(d)CMP kinase [Desulfarculaceae bacterium]MCF8074405.1 (d)CMP kinase [Desulfarculaceae bacterium]MCF8103619.1 (d)CMP kinase [Desulfarculaceae bacterium]MCF8116032.1 (d)CMP kinase [Desulfarculaceae bacterium]